LIGRDVSGIQFVGGPGEASDPGHCIPKDGIQLVPEVDEVVRLQRALQVPQVLSHAHPQDKKGRRGGDGHGEDTEGLEKWMVTDL
jgi:hypothetical protein